MCRRHVSWVWQEGMGFINPWVKSRWVLKTKGSGGNSDPVFSSPWHLLPPLSAHAFLHSGRRSQCQTILKHPFLQNSNPPVKLTCMLFLVFSTFPHSALSNPPLAWKAPGFICQSSFQASPACRCHPTGPCTTTSPSAALYGCSVKAYRKKGQAECNK